MMLAPAQDFLLDSVAILWQLTGPIHVLLKRLQGDHNGQILRFVDFNLEVPQCCPTALQLLPTLQLPKQNRAESNQNVVNKT